MKAGPTSPLPDNSEDRLTSPRGMKALPIEWLDARSWKLPSGQPLAEFAMRTGFLAPPLLARGNSRPAKSAGASLRAMKASQGKAGS